MEICVEAARGWRRLVCSFRLARFAVRHDVDLIHTNSLKADIIGGLAGRLAFRPVVWHVRDRIERTICQVRSYAHSGFWPDSCLRISLRTRKLCSERFISSKTAHTPLFHPASTWRGGPELCTMQR